MRVPRRGVRISFSLITLLAAGAGQARAQCGKPSVYELGGEPLAICTAGSLTEAMSHGRFIDLVSVPVSGAPSVLKTLAFDRRIRHMHTEFVGRIWATDGARLYGIDTSVPSSASVLGSVAHPSNLYLNRLRVKGNFVYASGSSSIAIFDVTNPGAPIHRSTLPLAQVDNCYDLEVVGSYAYVAISDGSGASASLAIVDISNPLAPFEVRRVNDGTSGVGVRLASGGGFLYLLHGGFLQSTVIERWNLANASNPAKDQSTVALSNASEQDELRMTATGVCRTALADSDTGSFGLYDKGTLAQVSKVTLPGNTWTMGVDGIYAFAASLAGEVSRINLLSPVSPVVDAVYRDVAPGYATGVATVNNGYSAVNSSTDLWAFRTPVGAAPTLMGHVHPDAGFEFNEDRVTLVNNVIFIAQSRTTPTRLTRIKAYSVTIAPDTFTFSGSIDLPGRLGGLAAGSDASSARRLYCTTDDGGGSTLRLINAVTLASMTQTNTFALTSGVSGPVHIIPAFPLISLPGRAYISGTSGQTQIVSVDNPGSLFSEGVIPASCRDMLHISNVLWMRADDALRAFDVSTPATPVLLSSLTMPGAGGPLAYLDPFGGTLGTVTTDGQYARALVQSPGAPSYLLIAPICETAAAGLSFDGTNMHVAATRDGYLIAPTNYTAPPVEDPSRPVNQQGRQGVYPSCGTQNVIPAHFVSNPATTTYQWFKTTNFVPPYTTLANGPTGTGSTLSGVTTDTLTITAPADADAAYYLCQAGNSCGTATTSVATVQPGGYANCNGSVVPPVLSAADFVCFLQRFKANNSFDPYPNCDGSTGIPRLTAADFVCYLQQFRVPCP